MWVRGSEAPQVSSHDNNSNIVMSLTPVSSSDKDIGGVPSMQSSYSAEMKQEGICTEERSVLCKCRSKSEETLYRLLITVI